MPLPYLPQGTKNPRDAQGRWLPGSSGGPGRGKSFAQLIKDATDDCRELVQIALRFARGEVEGQTTADQRWAIDFLANRSMGREVQIMANVDVVSTAAAELTREQLEALAGNAITADTNMRVIDSTSTPILPPVAASRTADLPANGTESLEYSDPEQ